MHLLDISEIKGSLLTTAIIYWLLLLEKGSLLTTAIYWLLLLEKKEVGRGCGEDMDGEKTKASR